MPDSPENQGKTPGHQPKIAKFADEPALPTGESSIEIIKDTDERDLKTAAEDANHELETLVSHPGDTPLEHKTHKKKEAEVEENQADGDEQTEVTEEPGQSDEQSKPADPADEDGLPDDPVTVRAIEEIVAEESDAVLAAEDLEREIEDEDELDKPKKPPKARGPIGRFFARPLARWLLFFGILAGIASVAIIPDSRYLVLNTAGVRSTLQLKVIDNGTLQPLKNVSITAGGASAQTDSEGFAKLTGVRLGKTTLLIEKRAFSRVEKPIVVGWGSNPLQDFHIQAVGAQYTFLIKDYLNGKPIDGAQAASGDGNASSDKNGEIILTLDTANQEDSEQVSVDISADGYRTETVSFTVSNKETQSVELVPARKHTFVSKRSGKFDVYTVDVDGKNEKKIVEGTGLERDDITLIPHQKEPVAAFVATRENVRNGSGYLLSTLYIIKSDSGELTKIDQSEKIQIIGWSKDGHLVYVKVASGASASDPQRYRLMSFNTSNFTDTKELAASNAFNDALMAGDRVYYAPSDSFQDDPESGVFAIDPTGQNKQTLLDQEAFALQRTSYETLDINTGETWYTYVFGSQAGAKAGQPAVAGVSKLYADNPSNNFSLWADERDGKGILLAYDRSTKEDRQLVSRSGLKAPVYWLNDSVAVYRVKDSRETADYVVSVDGGDARKITDVSGTAGLSSQFNY